MTDIELRNEYQNRYESILVGISTRLSELLSELVKDLPRIDRIAVRAKSPERFVGKARKTRDDGQLKYTAPFVQIQDLIGARIIVFYPQDVDAVSSIINTYFRRIESKELIPDKPNQFGYIGKHFILSIPEDVITDDTERDKIPTFFELQIKTLFQHAWSEAEHDISYKSKELLSHDQKRLVAFTAAQAWGADKVFSQLFDELG